MTYLSQYPSAKLKAGAPLRQRTNPNRYTLSLYLTISQSHNLFQSTIHGMLNIQIYCTTTQLRLSVRCEIKTKHERKIWQKKILRTFALLCRNVISLYLLREHTWNTLIVYLIIIYIIIVIFDFHINIFSPFFLACECETKNEKPCHQKNTYTCCCFSSKNFSLQNMTSTSNLHTSLSAFFSLFAFFFLCLFHSHCMKFAMKKSTLASVPPPR